METPPITEKDVVLLLDAVMTASEGVTFQSPGLIKGIAGLVEQLLARSGMMEQLPEFGEYIDAQKSAVKKLHQSPELFGALET
jgi:hypothetical protein